MDLIFGGFMKKFLALALLFISVSASAYVTGDKIHFQKDSTYVSAVYSKSLCLDGDTYRAVISKCLQWSNGDDRTCLRTGKVRATQPMVSTRQRCAVQGEDRCQRWETVRYVQDPVRTVTFFNSNGDELKTETVIVKACN